MWVLGSRDPQLGRWLGLNGTEPRMHEKVHGQFINPRLEGYFRLLYCPYIDSATSILRGRLPSLSLSISLVSHLLRLSIAHSDFHRSHFWFRTHHHRCSRDGSGGGSRARETRRVDLELGVDFEIFCVICEAKGVSGFCVTKRFQKFESHFDDSLGLGTVIPIWEQKKN